ncbi:hypothetical protein M378DRAFT_24110 [Amanita muscaria Koide BX008]|uniref:Uncharacterized protein n=1 Tax=Amanita muscaria (strain Koide BX008) TaxID=946122 RepID=A0A0C2TEN3_AMAMK|nr:hypothetical protein M378DRAFT_24110 [Amanita muscaria Koide BX008]
MQTVDIHGVLDNLQSVILLSIDKIPHIFHKSFSDWIMDAQHFKDNDYRIDPRDRHTWLTTRCLQTMNERLERNILKIEGVAQFMTNREDLKQKRITEKISPVLQYACIHWARHLNEANVDDANLIDELKIFADKHWLHWIEGVAWISYIISVHLNFNGVHKFMEKTTLQDLRELLYDALRFLSKLTAAIKPPPLFTYHSALPFTPTESLIYQRYNREMMDNICRVHGGPKRWDAVINIGIHGQHVDRVMFSEHDGFISCSAAVIPIWNSTTGITQGIINAIALANSSDIAQAVLTRNMIYIEVPAWSGYIEVSAPILSIALSFNGRRLAVALHNGNVTLWVVGVSKQIAEFDGYESDGHSSHHLAFSPNGDRIAYRLAGGGFALRNAMNGEHIADLNHNSAMVHRLIFSPYGSQLASLFVEDDDKHTLTLWDCTDGKFLGAIEDIGSELAFSVDGSLIATGGWNNGLKLWSRKDEDQDLHFTETRDLSSLGSISCLAFSQDGLLAIGSADTGIILYDPVNHSFLATIRFQNPTTIAFSYDCTRLALGNKDGVVPLLDVPAIIASAQMSQENSAPVSALMFSPDCSRLVSGSEDGIIRIWNTSCASEPIATREVHSSKVTTIAFTHNGGQFASGDANGTIILWSSKDYDLSNTIQWPISGGELTSVAVSKYVLAAATNDSIALWDLQTSSIIGPLGDCGSTLLSLSNHDENLFLASFDGHSSSFRVWDVGSRTPFATVKLGVGRMIERMVFYRDDSNLFAYLHTDDGSELTSFRFGDDISPNEVPISDPVDQGIVPSWKGIPVWMFHDRSNNNYFIRGWFNEGDGNYTYGTVCQLPADLDVVKAAYGSSMFALLCRNGCLILLQSN